MFYPLIWSNPLFEVLELKVLRNGMGAKPVYLGGTNWSLPLIWAIVGSRSSDGLTRTFSVSDFKGSFRIWLAIVGYFIADADRH